MRRYFSDWKGLAYNLAFFLNGLLVFLLIFENRFEVPFWLQAAGRMHPLVLHFPLVVLILYSIWVVLIEKPDSTRWNAEVAESLLIIGAVTAALAAFSGFILSKEDGYESDTLLWHKWLGVAISLLSLAWYGLRNYLFPWKLVSKMVAGAFLLILFVGGHLGGNLTHGEDFIISPLRPSESQIPQVALEEAGVYEHLVRPVLEQKCVSCHNEEKSKGNLQMQTQALLIKGGKNGVLWDTTKADLGLLISRVHLPLDDKKHMPPRGKVQLTEEEIVLLAAWVKAGSRFDQKVSSLSTQDPVYTYAQNILGGDRTEEQYDFSAADADEVKKLNSTYRLIKPLSAESPALFVNFYNSANFKPDEIEGLMPLKDQIVSMDLSKMPVKDADLKTLAKFPELRKLILNFTDITGASLTELKKLDKLKELSLSGTAVKMSDIKSLEGFPLLKKVYIWSTGLSTDELAALKKGQKIAFETGFRSDTVVLALTPPTIENENQILPTNGLVSMKHQIPQTIIRYTLDGSEPDSIKSPVYTKPFALEKNVTLKARAFRQGWYGSKQIERRFFKAGLHIDSVKLVKPADQKYAGKAGTTLIDGIKSENEQNSGKWLGYNEDFQSYLLFKKPVEVSRVTLSMLQNLGGHIFPPTRIEVWGGADEKSLKLLKVLTPEVPKKDIPGVESIVFEVPFEKQQVSCIKLVAKALPKLPAWHSSKGSKAWVFVDEVFVN
ncbi:FN3 associated domain-containing protein [Dyadobacter sp. CY326]|uniref:FN3 associated domain-containing protein n=1 Tax=Dyadobacter sp. CY326 TaxID=2907300 RepID=UPI001F25C115|nr:FN3 associated domain-containing protein [Dyadobacter sp. CY326]MCE7066965.1 chitobiase/beta-hexosaminidase C-terminal domain-containing protein [Dyadobacter sp. CY326]